MSPAIARLPAVVLLTGLIAGLVVTSPAHAMLGWYDQRNYQRCIEDAAATAAEQPAGPGRAAVHDARHKACYRKFFLDRLGISH
jgi:hypothetical protein